MAFLDTFPPKRRQFHPQRREALSGVIVVHTAESTPDVVLPDDGAEGVARFIQRRTDAAGSYHDIVDSDSSVDVVELEGEAFGVGTHQTNRHAVHLSFACHAHQWRFLPEWWVDGALDQAARVIARRYVPAFAAAGIEWRPVLIGLDDVIARRPGITTHALLDPDRRSDPGGDFPWELLLARLAHLDTPNPGDDDPMTPIHSLFVERLGALYERPSNPNPRRMTLKDASDWLSLIDGRKATNDPDAMLKAAGELLAAEGR